MIFDVSKNYIKSLIFISVSLILGMMTLTLDTRFLEFLSYPLYIVSLLLVFILLFVAKTTKGANAWFSIGGFGIQPSELAKITTSMALARYISVNNVVFDKPGIQKYIAYAIVALPMLLIILQNDTGTALVFCSTIFMFYREGFPTLWMIIGFCFILVAILSLFVVNYVILIAIVTMILFFWIFIFRWKGLAFLLVIGSSLAIFSFSIDYIVHNVLVPHQQKRIEAFINPATDPKGIGWNVSQSKIAIGSGTLVGKGYMKGTQTKYDFVPEQDTDFIFCTIGEEFGFLGSSFLVIAFFVFLYQIIFIAENSKSRYARVYGYCVASIYFFHVMINVGMTIGLAPVIGIPLPFFSYGGSSMMSFSLLFFILQNHYSNRTNVLATKF